jgi:TRAP transporter TAXI family solute receptor
VEYLPFGESVELMKNRQLDVTLQSAGLGVASIRDLATAVKIVVVPIPTDVMAKVGDPAYQPATIPANTYKARRPTCDRRDPQLPRHARGRAGRHGVCKMTKSMFENLDMMVAAHAAAKAIKRENAVKGMPLPLHPGAEKYYREVGLIK